MAEIHCCYIFEFHTPNEQKYDLYFDSQTMTLTDKSFEGQSEGTMQWAELESNKCSHCPLSSEQHKYCPTARALGRVAHKFSHVKSFTKTNVAVVTEERTYLKHTSTQEALQSIFGLIMATSGCPHLNFLKPMARFHLPFSSLNETMIRILSFHFLKQFFNQNTDSPPAPFNLQTLSESYEKVTTVNRHLLDRLASLGKGDADLNAVIILDSFASLLNYQASDNFSDLQPFFRDSV